MIESGVAVGCFLRLCSYQHCKTLRQIWFPPINLLCQEGSQKCTLDVFDTQKKTE